MSLPRRKGGPALRSCTTMTRVLHDAMPISDGMRGGGATAARTEIGCGHVAARMAARTSIGTHTDTTHTDTRHPVEALITCVRIQ